MLWHMSPSWPGGTFSPRDKKLIWDFKHFILSSAAALPKFLQCHSWQDRYQVSHMHDFLNGTSSMYVDETYRAWLHDPASWH